MKGLASFIMRGRFQAATLATAFALLAMMLPFLSYLSGAVIALVTLRRGPVEGAVIILIAALVVGIASQLVLGNVIFAYAFLLAAWLPVWILSVVLRRTVSLQSTVAVAGLLGLLVLLGVHAAVPDTTAWWREMLDKMVGEVMAQSEMGLSVGEISDVLDSMAELMTGFVASVFFLSLIFSLFLGRWWQALLFNPGGFKKEFFGLKLSKVFAAVGIGVFVWAIIVKGDGSSIPGDISTLMVTMFSLPGLAMMHIWVEKTGASPFWLLGLYIMLAIIPPQTMAGLAVAAIGDAWFDFRKFFVKRS